MFWKKKIVISQQTYDNFIPVLRFLRLCGFFPLGVQKDGSKLCLKWSPYYAVYSVVLGTFLIVRANLELMRTYILQQSHAVVRSPADKVTMIFAHDGWIIFYLFGIFVMSNKFTKLFNYIKLLNEVDEVIKTTYEKSEKYLVVLAILLTSLLAFIYCANNFRYIMSTGETFLKFADETICYYIIYVLCMPAFFIVSCLIWTLGKRFKRLNELLELENMGVPGGIKFIQMESKRIPRQSVRGTIEIAAKPQDDTITQLASTYLKLCDAAGIQNQIFGELVVVGVVVAFVQTVQPLYFLIVSASAKGIVMQSLIASSISIVRNSYCALLMIESAYSCGEQVKLTQKLVCQLFHGKIERRCRLEVRRFCLCLGLRNVVHSAAGVFNLDRFLFTAMTGSAVTFMLLLLQMEQETV